MSLHRRRWFEARALCNLFGHRWGEWQPRRTRVCERCGVTEWETAARCLP